MTKFFICLDCKNENVENTKEREEDMSFMTKINDKKEIVKNKIRELLLKLPANS